MKFFKLYILSVQSIIAYSDFPIYLALHQRNYNWLKEKLWNISNPDSEEYGKYLSSYEILNKTSPSIYHRNQLIDWLHTNNMNNYNDYGDCFKVITNNKIVSSVFFTDNNNPLKYTIPKEVRHIIDFVEMSSNITLIKQISKKYSKINIKGDKTVDTRIFSRESFLNLYNITNDNISSSQLSGVIEYQNNDGFLQSDLHQLQTLNNQIITNVTDIHGTNHGTDPESELDVQILSQTANGLNISYWETPYWLYGLSIDLYNNISIPNVVSMSWGWAEDSQCDIIQCINITSKDYVNRVNIEYIKLALRGTTITVSSGDAGAPGRTSEFCDKTRGINPIFPGSSPYVTTVGATFVEKDNSKINFTSPLCINNSCITGTIEIPTNYDSVEWTSGGGFSLYTDAIPYWQNTHLTNYLNNNKQFLNFSRFNSNSRSYPDISAVGHNCPTIIDGQLNMLDGTSCSSPIIAGIISIINYYKIIKNQSLVGFANPLLYKLSSNCPDCFNDITTGYNWCTETMCCNDTYNYGFKAVVGFDPVSGLGTPNIGRILEYLNLL